MAWYNNIGDIPIIGSLHKHIWGDTDAIKDAYDKQIAASQQQSDQMRDFLMGQKAQAQGIYGPLQHMFQAAYGTEGLQAPQVPQASAAGVGPLNRMYGAK